MATIVRAREDDWQTVRAIRLAALTADPSAFGSTLERELAYPEDRWRSWAGTKACFLAVEPNATVGLVTVKQLDEPADVELNALWVDPEHRGAGIGAALIAAVADWARSEGTQRLLLWVTTGNSAATRLYESLGFVRTGGEQPLPSDAQLTEVQFVNGL